MENIKDVESFAKKIVEESRHKFIYAYRDNRKLLIERIMINYPIKIDNKPSALYFKLDGLPAIDSKNLNSDAVSIINREYFNFYITSELIKFIIDNNDPDILKKASKTIINYANDCIEKGNIPNLQTLFELLSEAKQIYLDTYLNYMNKGILENPTEKTPFFFLNLEEFIYNTRKMLGKESHISLILDNEDEVSLESYKAINNLIGQGLIETFL